MREAELVIEAAASGSVIPLFTEGEPGLDEERAYAIARDVVALRLQRGERPVGRKIGFTNRTLWRQFGVTGPIWGHVYDTTVQHAEADNCVDVSQMVQPRLEPEIQLHFARAPQVTSDEEEILACIDWIALGFEFVQSLYADWSFKAPDAIAAFALHGHLLVGTPVRVTDIDDCVSKLRSFTVELLRGEELVATGGGENVLGSPLMAIAYLTETLAGQPDSPAVHAGEVVTTGTLTNLGSVHPGETWTARATGIELPPITVRTA